MTNKISQANASSRALLIQTITVLEDFLKKKELELDPARKDKVTVKLFENLEIKDVSSDAVDLIETAIDSLDLAPPYTTYSSHLFDGEAGSIKGTLKINFS